MYVHCTHRIKKTYEHTHDRIFFFLNLKMFFFNFELENRISKKFVFFLILCFCVIFINFYKNFYCQININLAFEYQFSNYILFYEIL